MNLKFSKPQWLSVTQHLLPRPMFAEEAAFAYMRADRDELGHLVLECIDFQLMSESDLSFQSAYHIEVSEEAQARVIKGAHDLDACLVELHSHVSDPGPQFSASDWHGFDEFVPHIWFRLKGKPYAAIVLSTKGLDAIAWIDDAVTPVAVEVVQVGQDLIRPSGLSYGSLKQWK